MSIFTIRCDEGEGVDSDVSQSEGAVTTRMRMKSLRVNVVRGCVARENVSEPSVLLLRPYNRILHWHHHHYYRHHW
jgi:hypothetical protein